MHAFLCLVVLQAFKCLRLTCRAVHYSEVTSETPDFVWPEALTFLILQKLQLSLRGVSPAFKALQGLSLLTSLQDLNILCCGKMQPPAINQYMPFLTQLTVVILPQS